jgi:FKBP-type peptidyl-prolyl cis-trans isomerase (trigger factor)
VKEEEVKGFRKGKAPAKLVEEKVGKQKLYTKTIQKMVPDLYLEVITRHKLQPISTPKFDIEEAKEKSDWKLKVTIAEKPEIILGNYKKFVSAALASSKIWVPGKENTSTKKDENERKQSTEEQISKVFDALLTNIKFDVSKFLIEEEINRQLSQLLSQIQRLGLTLDQYLASINKSVDTLKGEYRNQADKNLRLELILNEIAGDLKIKVEDAEIDKLISSVGDQKLRDNLKKPQEKVNIRASLRKRKVLDALLKM